MSDDDGFIFWAPAHEPPLRFRIWWAIRRAVARLNPRRGKWIEIGSTIDTGESE